MNSKGFNRAMVACLWIVLAFMYIPIIAIIGMSFNATPYGMFPYVFTFDWYKILFTESNLLPACVFSLKFAFGVTVAAIIIGTMASFGLQAYSPKWSNRLNALIQLPIIIQMCIRDSHHQAAALHRRSGGEGSVGRPVSGVCQLI